MVVFRTGCHIVTVALGIALVSPAFAADTSPAPPKAVQATIDCRRLSDDHARLACYDEAVDSLGKALGQGQVVAVDRSQVQAVRRQAFGFTLPSLDLFGRSERPQDVDAV